MLAGARSGGSRGEATHGQGQNHGPQHEDKAGASLMALWALTTRKHFCNIGKEETRLIKEVLVILGASEFGEGSHPPLLF